MTRFGARVFRFLLGHESFTQFDKAEAITESSGKIGKREKVVACR